MLTFFIFKRNIFGRKVSEWTLLSGWMSKVWFIHFYPFLNGIFSAEKCPNRLYVQGLDGKVWFFDLFILLIFKRNIFGWKVSERIYFPRFGWQGLRILHYRTDNYYFYIFIVIDTEIQTIYSILFYKTKLSVRRVLSIILLYFYFMTNSLSWMVW